MTTDPFQLHLRADTAEFSAQMLRVALSFEALGRAAEDTAVGLTVLGHRLGPSSVSRGRVRALRRRIGQTRGRYRALRREIDRAAGRETPERSAMHAAYRHRARRR